MLDDVDAVDDVDFWKICSAAAAAVLSVLKSSG